MSAPTRASLLHLYASTLRTSAAFRSYNYRTYFLRRTRNVFREIQHEEDPAKVELFYKEASEELEVLKRAAAINALFGGTKLVVERQSEVRERADS